MALGMVIAAFTETSAEDITSYNLVDEWQWYRIALYVGLIACWPIISRYATRTQANEKEASEDEGAELASAREKDFVHMRSQWWKIALLLVFVEAVLIQQFGLGG